MNAMFIKLAEIILELNREVAELRARRDFLLESNNRLVEERRAAEAALAGGNVATAVVPAEHSADIRDPRKDPRPGDVVRGKWRNPGLFKKHPGAIACQAVCGNLIAINSTNKQTVDWITLDEWCPVDAWVEEYEVLHVAGA